MSRPRKLWRRTAGSYGHTVTVCERQPGGPLYLRWWNASAKGVGGNWTWRGLRHSDRERGYDQARHLAGQLLAAIDTARAGRVTVAELLARYEREKSSKKKGAGPAEDARRIALWQTFLGGTRDVRSIDDSTLDRFVSERRSGILDVYRWGKNGERVKIKLSAHPGDTAIGADIIFLNAVLVYGTRVRLADGSRLVDSNPIRGYARPKNPRPNRPVATFDRFLKVRAKADQVDPQCLFGSFMDLVEALGWRVTAICQLWASDFDRATSVMAPFGSLRKRGEVDKEGVEMSVPLAERARAALDRALALHPVVGDTPIFTMPSSLARQPRRPWTRYHARELLQRAEKLADLLPIRGGDFHPYRRAWATARKHLPSVDVMKTGGWQDPRSLEKCYQQADQQTMLDVVLEPRKVRDAVITSA